MKNIRAGLSIGLTIATALFAKSLKAQGTFKNLDFELANVPALPAGQYGGGVPASDAIPFWSAYYGSQQVSMVLHNNGSIGSANISILGPNWDNTFGTSIIDGSYTAVLQAGNVGNAEHVSVSIAQSGTIPIDSESIRVKVSQFSSGSGLGITLGGQNLPLFLLERDAGYSLFGVDISTFAGQTTELRLSAPSTPGGLFNSVEIDDIVFSNQPIPEPGTLVLVLVGGVLMFVVISWPKRTMRG